ncbi:8637_t:CDS:2 [Scutellospora calospora]|uniref:8637_t:CDS:1 n=1 Tax=Scutellospora calospora TaxID=85575 RepID=A0ACA9L3X0_9GLOM|nr:8637_t:CDS:2 [Scutellospora calospora]
MKNCVILNYQVIAGKEYDPLLSIEGRKVALLERQIKARKEAAEAEAIELQTTIENKLG